MMPAALRRLFRDLRTEGAGAGRESVAIGVGVFIGCLPFYGFHLLLCWGVGWLLRLNRLKIYIAANISNPLVAPTLVFTELQAGAWLRRGAFHPLTLEAAKTTNLSVFGLDILVGALAIGGTLGTVLGLVTYASTRGTAADAQFLELVRATADRYITSSITAWEFARGKLRGDVLYRVTVCGGVLPSGGTLVDIGCGGGLSLALLAEARNWRQSGRWPSEWPAPPVFDRMVGVETRAKAAAVAREALGGDAEIVHADARSIGIEPCRAVLIFDVLHMIPEAAQEALIAAVARSLEPDGVLLIREADATGGWRFWCVRLGNGLKALVFGHWRQRFHFRTPEQWLACFASHGMVGQVTPAGEGTPFANVLLRVTVPAKAPATAATRPAVPAR